MYIYGQVFKVFFEFSPINNFLATDFIVLCVLTLCCYFISICDSL
jgi:hypothetical protein